MAKTETLHVRIDPDTKRSTDEILSVLGLSTAEAVNISCTRLCFAVVFRSRLCSRRRTTKRLLPCVKHARLRPGKFRRNPTTA